jgi:hypothetical protein
MLWDDNGGVNSFNCLCINTEQYVAGVEDKDALLTALLSLVCALGAKLNTLMSNIVLVVEQLQEITGVFAKVCCSKVTAVLESQSDACEVASEVGDIIMDIPNFVQTLGQKYKIEKALKERGFFTGPTEMVLGTREERRQVKD